MRPTGRQLIARRPAAFRFLVLFFLLLSAVPALAEEKFTFAAAGDFGAVKNTDGVLKGVSKSGADFLLMLGDLSYNDVQPEKAWGDYVRKFLGKDLPVQILSGNHEENGEAGTIDEFVKVFPDRMLSSGIYGKEYYFDYPKDAPFARFIQLSPDLDFAGTGKFSYALGSEHFDWLDSAIDGARKQGIRWIIVSMHKDCITMGNKSCEVGADLFNQLLRKKVDVILQGHDHNFQRSWPLILGPACPSLAPDSFEPACSVKTSLHDYKKGDGTILSILGTGGRPNYPLNPSDTERGYFAAPSSPSKKELHGFGLFEISRERLSFRFIQTNGHAPEAKDRFEITSDGPDLIQ